MYGRSFIRREEKDAANILNSFCFVFHNIFKKFFRKLQEFAIPKEFFKGKPKMSVITSSTTLSGLVCKQSLILFRQAQVTHFQVEATVGGDIFQLFVKSIELINNICNIYFTAYNFYYNKLFTEKYFFNICKFKLKNMKISKIFEKYQVLHQALINLDVKKFWYIWSLLTQ